MISSYVRQSRHILRRWVLDPGTHLLVRRFAYVLAGFCLSAASLEQGALPLVLGLVWACRGGSAVLAAVGGMAGYGLFWGQAGVQGILWTAFSLGGVLLLGDRRISRELPLLVPSVGMLTVSAVGLGFQLLAQDTTSVVLYLIRVALGGVAPWLFSQVLQKKSTVCRWFTWGLMTLSLAQIMPVSWLSLGFVAAGTMTVVGAFPCAAVAGLALDLARITAVPMTAVVVLGSLVRFLPRCPKWAVCMAPGLLGILMMRICNVWDANILPGLFLGGMAGYLRSGPEKTLHRRGETGVAQVRLEMAAGMLAQIQQLLMEAPEPAVDEDALVARAAEQACAGCSARKNCRDTRRIAGLPGLLLHKPLLTGEEIPVQCRKASRFLAELHRSQERLRSIQADRERQREYREAVIQQYQFLSTYLRSLSDRLSSRAEGGAAVYNPVVSVYGNRSQNANADRCLQFAGPGNQYYILLCDGMGTGLGAVQEGKTAGNLLRRMLTCGFPAEEALRSLNSLCALRDRAGAVTVDLAQVALDSGKVTIYKWGAAASYLVSDAGTEKLGAPSVPPGLSVTDRPQVTCNLTLRKEQLLLMASDGLADEQVLRCCREEIGATAEGLARTLLTQALQGGEDDATVVTIQLFPAKL